MGRYYILEDERVVEEPDHEKWAEWYQGSRDTACRIARTKVVYGTVETVFLGMNMTLAEGPPQLFETKVHGGWLDGEWARHTTVSEAKRAHEAWVARVHAAEENQLPPPGWQW